MDLAATAAAEAAAAAAEAAAGRSKQLRAEAVRCDNELRATSSEANPRSLWCY